MLEESELRRLATWVRQLTTEQLAATLAMCEAERDRRRSEAPLGLLLARLSPRRADRAGVDSAPPTAAP